MTGSWYEIKAKKNDVDLYIYDEIGFFGISASRLVAELQRLKGKALNVFINSPGGDVFDSVAIYNALVRHDGEVNVSVDGIAASGASVIAQAGKSRTMATGSSMMIHDAWGIAMGDEAVMEKMRGELGKISDSIADIYAERAGETAESWRERMKEETWFNAEEAVEAGLADIVAGAAPQAELAGRVFNLSKFSNVPERVQKANAANAMGNTNIGLFAGYTGSANNNPPSTPPNPAVQDGMEVKDMADLTEVRRILGIDEDGDPIQAIQSLKSQAKDIATGEKGAENALRRDNAQLRQQLLEQESDYGQRILALEDRNRQKEAAYAVDSAIQAGRVAPKDRDLALKLALNDAEGFEKFAANLRVDLNERGMAMDSAMAAIEPTAEELAIAKQMGQTREQIMAEKAREKGIALPS